MYTDFILNGDPVINLNQDDGEEVPIDSRFNLPENFKMLRKSQLEAAELTYKLFESGVDVVVVDATPGFGKSIFAELVRQLMKTRMLYVCPKNELLEQMQRSLPYAKTLCGRSNYPHGMPGSKKDFVNGVTCAECNKGILCGGPDRPRCKYKRAKELFQTADVGITNTAYFMVAANYLGMFSEYTKKTQDLNDGIWKSWGDPHLTVWDEADSGEEGLLGFFRVSITQEFLKKVIIQSGLKDSTGGPYPLPIPPVYSFDSWMSWMIKVRELIEKAILKHNNVDINDIPMVAYVNKLKKLKLNLDMVECDWIYDPVREKNSSGIRNGPAESVTLQPLVIGDLGKDRFWNFCGKTICMSGSIVSLEIFAEETGLDKSGKTYRMINYDSPWNPNNRSIFRVPGVEVVKKSKQKSWNKQDFWEEYVGNIAWILQRHPDERTLIHSISHELAMDLGRDLSELFGNRIIISQSVSRRQKQNKLVNNEEFVMNKDEALEEYVKKPGKVIITASLTRGTDLFDDLCRNIIIAKNPFPNLGDRRMKSLLNDTENGQIRYMIKTVREIIQMVWRGVRHSQDWCRIWSVDDKFDSTLKLKGLFQRSFLRTIRDPGDYMCRIGK